MTTHERRAVVLVDGEHHPPVVGAALADLARRGTRPAAVLYLGGSEKVLSHGAPVDLPVPAEWAPPGADAGGMAASLRAMIERLRPDVVVDLSDEPVLDARRRMALAAHALHAGVPYEGPDFALTPPERPRLADRPSIAVIGTGKRSGKTAVTGDLVRSLAAGTPGRPRGRTAVVVAMGRGGPARPAVVEAGLRLDSTALLEIADRGDHAAGDHYEDALTTGAATVGARRCGGGLAGAVGTSNVAEAVAMAGTLPGDLLVLEGSGAAIPPAHADATLLVVPASADPETVGGYLGPYRLLLADLVVVTMGEPPTASPKHVDEVVAAIRSVSRDTPLLRTVFRPYPLEPVRGARVFFATTAQPGAVGFLGASLEQEYGCKVVATSASLADRPALLRDLEASPPFEVLLVELKAAAVDVAVRFAARAGARVVFCDNRLRLSGGPQPGDAWERAVEDLSDLATHRFGAQRPGS